MSYQVNVTLINNNINPSNNTNIMVIKMKNLRIFLLILFVIIMVLQVFMLDNNDRYKMMYKKYVPDLEKEYFETANHYDVIDENFEFIPAKVVSNYNGILNNIFIVNKGSIDGVNAKSFVINEEGLVGEIVKTFKAYSVVRFIFSNETKLSIEINGCYGTLYSKNNRLFINDLINCENVSINDSVFTSKYNYSSSNILVGYISEIDKDNISIKPAINKYKIKYVGIINDNY